jgi:ribosomal protein S12 methylthiotransferase
MMVTAAQKKVCLVSLGCPKNLVDAELMLGSLKQEGFELTTSPEEAQVLVVNTCSFIKESKEESIDRLLEMAEYKKTGQCQVLVSTGCLSQRYGTVLGKEMPEIDLILGTGEFDRLPQLLREKGVVPPQVSSRQILPDPDRPRILATPSHYSYVKVSEGCSHHCSFCIIPKIRGGLKSRPLDSVLREVRSLVQQGVKEFNLIAQDLNEYGRDLKDGTSLVRLIRELDCIDGEFWLRPLYMYPLLFNDELIEALAASPHWTRYIDIPLQHIDDQILRSMRRGSSSRYIRDLLEKLRKAVPDIAIRTTFIVGYPGETEEQFRQLHEFVGEAHFDHVGVFSYSQEEDTEAFSFPDPIDEKLQEERRGRLMELQKSISWKKNQARVGTKVKILVEGTSEENEWVRYGRLASQAPEIDGVTYLSEGSSRPGEFISVKITEAHDYDLVASSDELS